MGPRAPMSPFGRVLAALGPIIDTLIVCTCTALVILLASDWQNPEQLSGITLTANAFRAEMGLPGLIALGFVALILNTTMFTGWYYGACFGFLVGAQWQPTFAGSLLRRWCLVPVALTWNQPHIRQLWPDGNTDHGQHPAAGTPGHGRG